MSSGIPYSLSEAEAVVKSHAMDEYHRELMRWLIAEVRRSEEEGSHEFCHLSAEEL